jgi:hypothetical protein
MVNRPSGPITGGNRGRGAAAAGSMMLTIARLVKLVFGLLALVVVVAIVLRLLDANASNVIVRDVHDTARDLVGPARNLFSIHDPKLAITVNWGIAAVFYAVVGGFLARAIARMAPAPRY